MGIGRIEILAKLVRELDDSIRLEILTVLADRLQETAHVGPLPISGK